MKLLWVLCLVWFGFVHGAMENDMDMDDYMVTDTYDVFETDRERVEGNPLMVNMSIIKFAADIGAVCLDGSLPAYHFHQGFGSGVNNWLVNLEGGGWCYNRRTCEQRKASRHGSSDYMEKSIPFIGILSNKPEENPDFFKWNRVKIRYCDGASFSGDGYHKRGNLTFGGQRIWSAAMAELMSKGMNKANQALLSGCSAGGLSAILHCDEFSALFPESTRVKCLADAGFFVDALNIKGVPYLRSIYEKVVRLQGVDVNLPEYCTSRFDTTSCFFPQNIVGFVKTPLFLINSAYDLWQIHQSIVPLPSDPDGSWTACKNNLAKCNSSQLNIFQEFRNEMIHSLKGFKRHKKNGLFLNSCFAHCQSERQQSWYAIGSP